MPSMQWGQPAGHYRNSAGGEGGGALFGGELIIL